MHLYIMQGEEFKRRIDINGFQLYEGDKVFVMWNWAWFEEIHSSNDDSRSDDLNVTEEFKDDSDASSDDDTKVSSDILSITHSMIFKCIGNLKEHRYQEILALAKKKINEGKTVRVIINKEPDNPVDSKAIAFACNVTGSWERISDVVQEVLDEVNKAMDDGFILKVN